MTDFSPLQLAPFQEKFLQSFLTRSDQRTLLVAAPGMGKTATSHVAATRMVAAGLVDKVLLISAHRALGEQWQHVGQGTDPWPVDAAGDVSVTTTYAALARDPDRMWREVAADTRWLFVFDEVDWAGDQVEAIVASAIARFPGSRALFVSTEVPPIAVDSQFTFEFFGSDSLARPDTQSNLQKLAPSSGLLQNVQRKLILLDDLSWREFEELIAKMLEADGYRDCAKQDGAWRGNRAFSAPLAPASYR
ncbi:DEAD/DEAH box helicase family protein [Mesorhizobium sp. M1227]|uniref:DEAD/DEAH box helicase family protein n=1 Tax=Mesorhizobium sp. M1227 TaxID=2957071 RepID=UPI00333C6E3F